MAQSGTIKEAVAFASANALHLKSAWKSQVSRGKLLQDSNLPEAGLEKNS